MPVNAEPSPTNLVAVTTPLTNASPVTCNFEVGNKVPIPRLPSLVRTILVVRWVETPTCSKVPASPRLEVSNTIPPVAAKRILSGPLPGSTPLSLPLNIKSSDISVPGT